MTMIGLDPAAIVEAFLLPEDQIPVMLIASGYAVSGNWPQKLRKPVGEVMTSV